MCYNNDIKFATLIKNKVVKMKYDIVRTNIINAETEAIVLPANKRLKESSGISNEIFKAAGRKELKKACNEIGRCRVGSAVPTPAFNMNSRYIIHAVSPRWKNGKSNEYELLSSAYLTSLKIADVMECDSIAFPLLASGHNRFDRELAFKIAIESIEAFENTNLKKVLLVIYDENTECFVKSLGHYVAVMEDMAHPKKDKNNEEFKMIVSNGLKSAGAWLKDRENQKKLANLAINVTLFVLGGRDKKTEILEDVKKIINK